MAMLGMMLGRPFGIRMRTCQDVARLLSDYMDGDLEYAERRSIALHILACEDCLHYVETFRQTQDLVREIRYEKIPAEFRSRLHSVLNERLRNG